jgi:hypothetical protein
MDGIVHHIHTVVNKKVHAMHIKGHSAATSPVIHWTDGERFGLELNG